MRNECSHGGDTRSCRHGLEQLKWKIHIYQLETSILSGIRDDSHQVDLMQSYYCSLTHQIDKSEYYDENDRIIPAYVAAVHMNIILLNSTNNNEEKK